MRQFPTAIKGELARRHGSEPVIVAEIEFVPGAPIAFSTSRLNDLDEPRPQIVSVGELDSTTLATITSDSQSTSVVLSDLDGSLKTLIDTNDISLGKVTFYLCFQGVSFSEKTPLLQGVIFSPIRYSTIEKTLSFSVVSSIADAEVGFSMDDGDFPDVPEDQRGQGWPLIFGTVCAAETLSLKPIFKGTLGEPVGAVDPTIGERLCQAYRLQCPEVFDDQYEDEVRDLEQKRNAAYEEVAREVAGVPPVIAISANFYNPGYLGLMQWTDDQLRQVCLRRVNRGFPRGIELEQIPGCSTPAQKRMQIAIDFDTALAKALEDAKVRQLDCLEARQSQICKILTEKEQQEPYAKTSFTVVDGEKFPQNTPITIRIGTVKFLGVMNGDTFTVSGVDHPSSREIENPVCRDLPLGYTYQGAPSFDFPPTSVAGCEDKPELVEVLTGPGATWKYFFDFKEGKFIWLPSGTDVFLEQSSTITHIVSLVPGAVTQVAAYRTFGDSKILTEVDTDEYTVFNRDFGDYTVVEVQLNRLLSEIPDEQWDDTIYVNFTSSVGPNPVNVIKFLIETYTNYTWDPVSFAAVTTSLANYPVNFVSRERTSVSALIKDIAYQSRCAVTIREDVVYLTYLSKEPNSVRTLTDADILRDTFETTSTKTEDINTKHVINWKATEAKIYPSLKTEEVLTLKHNVGRYGSNEVTHNYYTQNTFSTIQKSATFWMIRDANSWVYVEFETTLANLDLDVYDCITIDYPGFPITKCIIEDLRVNFDTFTIRFKCWTPILAGTSVPYQWAWPATLAATALFPDPDYTDRGDGLNKTVRPPVGHPLRQGYNINVANRLATDGDRNPSDIGDVFPTSRCFLATPSEFSADIAPRFTPFEAQAWNNFASDIDRRNGPIYASTDPAATSGASGDGTQKQRKKKDACGFDGYQGCVWLVTVTYVNSELIRPGCTTGPCVASGIGFSCSGVVENACHSFGSEEAAESFRAAKQAEIESVFCSYQPGQWQIYLVSNAAPQYTKTCNDPNRPAATQRQTSVFTPNESLRGYLDGLPD